MTNALSTASSTTLQLGPIGFDEAKRHALIAEAAYLLSEARGFEPGWELQDWLDAEWEIDQRLASHGLGHAGPADLA